MDEIYSDGIGEITVTGPIVRIDLVSLSPQQRDASNNPTPVFRQRIIMSVEAFANSAELMRKAVDNLIKSGAITKVPQGRNVKAIHADSDIIYFGRNSSPNFS